MTALQNWRLSGTILQPTDAYLRAHVNRLSRAPSGHYLTLLLSGGDRRLVPCDQLALSESLLASFPPTCDHTLDFSAHDPPSVDLLRKYLFCAPVDLAQAPVQLPAAAWHWRCEDLYTACFLVAETAPLSVFELIERFLPVLHVGRVPCRFVSFLVGRLALQFREVLDWVHTDCACGPGKCKCLHASFWELLQRNDLLDRVSAVVEWHSDGDYAALFHDISIKYPTKPSARPAGHQQSAAFPNAETASVMWRLDLGRVLSVGAEYDETERPGAVAGASLAIEACWSGQQMVLLVGLQGHVRTGLDRLVAVRAFVIGEPCQCADEWHNTGRELTGGKGARTMEWFVSHEHVFAVMDSLRLADWKGSHSNQCRLVFKVTVSLEVETEENL